MISHCALLTLTLLLTLTHINCQSSVESSTVKWDNFYVFKNIARLDWKVDTTKKEIRLRFESHNPGWIGIGWSPSDGKMMNADMVIMTRKSGELVVQDYFSRGFVTPTLDKSQDIKQLDAGQENGVTWMEFSRPFETTDSDDRPITQGSMRMVWALGRAIDSLEIHSEKGAEDVILWPERPGDYGNGEGPSDEDSTSGNGNGNGNGNEDDDDDGFDDQFDEQSAQGLADSASFPNQMVNFNDQKPPVYPYPVMNSGFSGMNLMNGMNGMNGMNLMNGMGGYPNGPVIIYAIPMLLYSMPYGGPYGGGLYGGGPGGPGGAFGGQYPQMNSAPSSSRSREKHFAQLPSSQLPPNQLSYQLPSAQLPSAQSQPSVQKKSSKTSTKKVKRSNKKVNRKKPKNNKSNKKSKAQ